jgi:hypothetical protein
MVVRCLLLAVLVAGLSGCTTSRLRQRTVNQAATLPELQYQQVLDNLARFATNPSALPWHVNLREGTTQITDGLSGGAAVDLGPPTEWLPQLFGSRTVVAQWGVTPVIDPTELRLLRIAYRRAYGSPELPDPELMAELTRVIKGQVPLDADLRDETELFFEYQLRAHDDYRQLDASVVTANDELPYSPVPRVPSPLAREVARQLGSLQTELSRIGPGWFHIGTKHEVPRDACYVGHDGPTYVWVCPEGREALTQFTLTAMKLGTLVKETQTLISPGSVKFSPGDRG